jgi:hypothetical protein
MDASRENGGSSASRATTARASGRSSDSRTRTTPKPLSVEDSDAQVLAYMKEVLALRSLHPEVLFLSLSLSVCLSLSLSRSLARVGAGSLCLVAGWLALPRPRTLAR